VFLEFEADPRRLAKLTAIVIIFTYGAANRSYRLEVSTIYSTFDIITVYD
jgi:hypothetical protein